MTIKHVVSFSGGIASAMAAFRVVERYGSNDVVLLFADTLMEDEDLYRFNRDVEAAIGIPITRIADGRDPWQVFRDEKFLGNSQADPCSKILKRKLLDKWCQENAPYAQRHVGIWWDEAERLTRLQARNPAIKWASPLLWKPAATHKGALDCLESKGIAPPRLYAMGFSHNNCGGFCVKAGQAQFAKLLRELPDRYRHHEAKEEAIRDLLGDVSILRDRRGGTTKTLPLRVLRERIERQQAIDYSDCAAGCGCAIDAGDDQEVGR